MHKNKAYDMQFPYFLVLIFLIFAAGIISVGYFNYRDYSQRYRIEIQNQLSAIADLKVEELVQWRRERLADGSVFFKNPAFTSLVRRYFNNPQDADARDQIQTWLARVKEHVQYSRIRLLDVQGRHRLAAPADELPLSAAFRELIPEIVRSGKVVFLDFYRNEYDQRIYLSVIVPVIDAQDNNRVLGILALSIDPEQYLYPLLQRWPTPSRTAETLIVRRDGNDALFLNQLKYRKDTALNLSIPLTKVETPAVQAALGYEGGFEGIDYRGEPAIAHVHAVPDSPWSMVSRMDTAEVYAPLQERLRHMMLIIIVLLCAMSTGLLFFWRQQRVKFYRDQLEAEREKAWLQNIITQSLNEVYVFDPLTLHLTYANAGALRNIGYSMDELSSLTPLDINPTYTEQTFRSAVQPLVSGEREMLIFETYHRRKNGSIYPAEVHLQLMPTGERLIFLAITNDITDRMQAEDALRESNELLTLFIKHSPIYTYINEVTSTESRVVQVSDNFERINGFPASEMIGKTLTELFPTEWGTKRTAADWAIVSSGQMQESEEIYNGRSYTTINFPIVQGAKNLLAGFTIDITDRKQAADEIKASRDILETIFKTCPDIIMFMDDSGIIVKVNDEIEALTGYSPQELAGQNSGILLPEREEDRLPVRSMLKFFFEHGFVKNHALIWRKKDGSNVYLECNTMALRDDSQNITGTISVMRDMSERKKIEEQLRQSQKMEAIGTLAGGIAHDFNNILGAIIGFTELSCEQLAKDDPVIDNLEKVLQSSMRASDLVKQILAFSRKAVSVHKPVQVHHLVDEVLKLLRASIPATIEIRFDCTAASDTVMADSSQLHQVLLNLCTNAAQAMEEKGGVLEIGLKPVILDVTDVPAYADLTPGPYVHLTVRDTGPGIDPRILDRIFEPFFTTKEVGRGTGLGLAVVHGIVKSHHGAITVYSEPGRGSTFHVLLPRVQDGAGSAELAAPEQAPPGGSESILFIDDEAFLADLGHKILESLGYRVTTTRSSIDALELFMKNPGGFDLVITDQTMPQLTGYELSQRLMEIRKNIPIILCTGYSDLVSAETALAGGIKAFMIKPMNRLAIAEMIRQVLDKSAAEREAMQSSEA